MNDNILRAIAQFFEDCDTKGCEDCPKFSKTTDCYGTGDSPTCYECEVSDPEDCGRLDEITINLSELYD